MKTTELYFFCALMLGFLLAPECKKSSTQPVAVEGAIEQPKVAISNLQEIALAREALIAFISHTNDSMLRAILPGLTNQPVDLRYPQAPPGSIFSLGAYTVIDLPKRSWSIDLPNRISTQLYYRGEFRTNVNGKWEAISKGVGERYFRREGGQM
jgi:hypothetical protein